ncbi:MAG: methyltransferase domain-containing protein [Chloracidobacterium sp.]|uniref:Class I SAM-dependent methyltransferase n=1 Tax=Chloracidobacterium validum TaxID=2821543 RepID=A0ABX8B8E4_9BACT|nr:class I SAM-dependent methyltransferase [Chloracidobacterium validum]QUW02717.1 class I SAM-dependent methyltransferase [Chloracidobacterium validum]
MPDVLAQWITRLDGQRVLDIGCGRHKTPGAVGLDANPQVDADVVHDLDDVPYPFAESSFDAVIGRHVIEHVQAPLAVITELHRIVRPGGWVLLVAPHWTNPDFATDLTHRNHLNSYSFRNLTVGNEVFDFYASARFHQRPPYVTLLNLWRACGIEWLVNLDRRHAGWRFLRRFWEQYGNAIARGKEIYFELEVVKTAASST